MRQLATLTGLARHFGVSRQAVDKWTTAPRFPKSREVLGGGRVWDVEQVESWRARRVQPLDEPPTYVNDCIHEPNIEDCPFGCGAEAV